jgi:hypothetical protein
VAAWFLRLDLVKRLAGSAHPFRIFYIQPGFALARERPMANIEMKQKRPDGPRINFAHAIAAQMLRSFLSSSRWLSVWRWRVSMTIWPITTLARCREDLLSVLLATVDEESGVRISDRQLRDETMTAVFGRA